MLTSILIALALAAFVHEAAHVIAAISFGVPVTSIGLFEPILGFGLRLRVGKTQVRIGLLPFGGYTRLGGMPEHLRTGQPDISASVTHLDRLSGGAVKWDAALSETARSVIAPVTRPGDGFHAAPHHQQQIILAAGILANTIAAAVACVAAHLSGPEHTSFYWALSAVNAVDAIWNALPLSGHDGQLLSLNHRNQH